MYVAYVVYKLYLRVHVYIQVGKIPNLDIYKVTVTDILMACQNYMRHKKVFIEYLYVS